MSYTSYMSSLNFSFKSSICFFSYSFIPFAWMPVAVVYTWVGAITNLVIRSPLRNFNRFSRLVSSLFTYRFSFRFYLFLRFYLLVVEFFSLSSSIYYCRLSTLSMPESVSHSSESLLIFCFFFGSKIDRNSFEFGSLVSSYSASFTFSREESR